MIKLKTILATGAVLFTLGVKNLFSQVSSAYLEGFLAKYNDPPNKRNASFIRGTIDYPVSSDINGNSWLELHNGSFISRNTFFTNFYSLLGFKFGIKGQIRFINELMGHLSLGPKITLPSPEGSYIIV